MKIVMSDSLAQQALQKCAAFPESHNLRILLGFGHFNLSLPADISFGCEVHGFDEAPPHAAILRDRAAGLSAIVPVRT